jgi:hypothetical protein
MCVHYVHGTVRNYRGTSIKNNFSCTRINLPRNKNTNVRLQLTEQCIRCLFNDAASAVIII